MNRFWTNDEFDRTKKNPFEHNFFPFYEFLAPETDIMVQFLEPETDVMVQFLAPEIVIMGERNYISGYLNLARKEAKSKLQLSMKFLLTIITISRARN